MDDNLFKALRAGPAVPIVESMTWIVEHLPFMPPVIGCPSCGTKEMVVGKGERAYGYSFVVRRYKHNVSLRIIAGIAIIFVPPYLIGHIILLDWATSAPRILTEPLAALIFIYPLVVVLYIARYNRTRPVVECRLCGWHEGQPAAADGH